MGLSHELRKLFLVRSFAHRCHVLTGSGTNPAAYPVSTEGSDPKVTRPRREDEHSPPPGADIMSAWSYTFIRPYVLMP
jgi:hypothetical protein